MKTTIVATVVSILTIIALPSYAENNKDESALHDAWLDGKLDTVILLNPHLNPFKIDTGVTNSVAILSGKVDSEVEKSLATELAKGIEGISEVKNHIQVKTEQEVSNSSAKSKAKKATGNLTDAAITTAISTKLLLNTNIDSTEIDVDTDNAKVKLSGSVNNRAESDLVEQIAKNTFEVKSVANDLAVKIQ